MRTTTGFNPALRNLAHSFMTTAIEGGIGYWCQLRRYAWYGFGPRGGRLMGQLGEGEQRVVPCLCAEMNDDEDGYDWPNAKRIGAKDMLVALQRLARGEVPGIHVSWRKKAAAWLAVPEDADFDSNDADVVFQVAFFGTEVKYG